MFTWIKYKKGRPTKILFQGGDVDTLKEEIKAKLPNKLKIFDIDDMTLRAHGKKEILREDMIIDENFVTSYNEPVYIETVDTLDQHEHCLIHMRSAKKKVMDDFPRGLQYKKPKLLLHGVGGSWVYQPEQTLHETLRMELRKHYKYYLDGVADKTFIPIYLFLSGAGTGKSRNAEEFHNTALTCLLDKEDLELKERIKNAWVLWVFNVRFENGHSLRNGVEMEAYSAIGTRILQQLLPERNLELIIAEYEAPLPWQIFELVAKYEGIEMKDATIFLIIDGLQNIMNSSNDWNDQSSNFFKTLTNIHDLALRGTFMITLCTATVTNSVEVLNITHRKCVELPIASLTSPTICINNTITPVFEIDDYITKILVDDCGGHGRVLEILQEILEKYDIRKANMNV